MRKLWAILFIAAMLLTLCACSGANHRSIEQDAYAYISVYGAGPVTVSKPTATTKAPAAAPAAADQQPSGEPGQTAQAQAAPAQATPAPVPQSQTDPAAAGGASGEASGGPSGEQ